MASWGKGYRMIASINRDEFLNRPTIPSKWHNFSTASDSPTEKCILSSLDLQGGGTQIGVSVSTTRNAPVKSKSRLRFAALTNYTETLGGSTRSSRGDLTRNFLSHSFDSEDWVEEYISELEQKKSSYAGFNLVLAEFGEAGELQLGYETNRDGKKGLVLLDDADEDIHVRGVSNGTMSLPSNAPEFKEWPKVSLGKFGLAQAIRESNSEEELKDKLLALMSTASQIPITKRIHARHSILIKPIFFSPEDPLPNPEEDSYELEEDLDLPNHQDHLDPHIIPKTGKDLPIEGSDNRHWYATRTQTLVFVKQQDGEKTWQVRWIERDAYYLDEHGQPKWSGKEREYSFQKLRDGIVEKTVKMSMN